MVEEGLGYPRVDPVLVFRRADLSGFEFPRADAVRRARQPLDRRRGSRTVGPVRRLDSPGPRHLGGGKFPGAGWPAFVQLSLGRICYSGRRFDGIDNGTRGPQLETAF